MPTATAAPSAVLAARLAWILHAAFAVVVAPLALGGLTLPFLLGTPGRAFWGLSGVLVVAAVLLLGWLAAWLWLSRLLQKAAPGGRAAVIVAGVSEAAVAGTGAWLLRDVLPGGSVVGVLLALVALAAAAAAMGSHRNRVPRPQGVVIALLVLQVLTTAVFVWFVITVPASEPEGDGFAEGLAWFVILVVGVPLSLAATAVWSILLAAIRSDRRWWPGMATAAAIATIVIGALWTAAFVGIPWLVLGILLLYTLRDRQASGLTPTLA